MKINTALLGILVTVTLTLGGWMLTISSAQEVNRTMILANAKTANKINDNQEELIKVIHKLDKTLAKFEGQFVTKEELRVMEKELIDRLREYLDNKR